MTEQTRVRRDVTKMLMDAARWDDDLLWYARAVQVMMSNKDKNDPLSWIYQANIHGSGGDMSNPDYWNKCPHGGWFFLPWHRAYLYYFERIVRKVIRDMGGPDTWALPYWNYSRVVGGDPGSEGSLECRRLPVAFRRPRWPDGATDNPLFTGIVRSDAANQGFAANWQEQINPTAAMQATVFPGAQPYFGSKNTGTSVPHSPGEYGALEAQPHNPVHGFVGGWMGQYISPRDPIFWLHHANIDRIWVAWLEQTGRENPGTDDWRDTVHKFHDETRAAVQITAKGVLTTEQIGYRYESNEVWIDPTLTTRRSVRLLAANPGPTGQLLGEAGTSELGAAPVAAPLLPQPSAPEKLSRSVRPDTPERVVLTIQDVRADDPPGTTYRVLMGADEGRESELDPEGPFCVGHIDFFGAVGDDAEHHGGNGVTFSFDVTDQLHWLQQEGLWDGSSVPQVVLVPVPLEPPPGQTAVAALPLTGSRPRYGNIVLTSE